MVKKNLHDRFFSKVNKTDGCWEWTAHTLYNGYGRFSIHGKTSYSHRVSWLIEHGEWPSSHVMHTCDNPACVRPDHLSLGNMTTNMHDRDVKERQYRNSKTHCRHGYEFAVNPEISTRRTAKDCLVCEIQRNYSRNAKPETKKRKLDKAKAYQANKRKLSR